ncbi:MBL fold metallo-hydrolase [Sphingobacterium sp. Mn56C]|uniref:MBL fold metallo-hydrolase n=1 Tax=Sphingobacterium sp. Mn56C TaxID=3395261 RepID=UPI003BC73988
MNRRFFIHRSLVILSVAAAMQGFSCFGHASKKATSYHIEQFEDEGLAHFSYAILVDNKIVLIDPARDPRPYYAYAKEQGAEIVAVIETHPHADFVSSHLEIHRDKKVPIYVSKLVQATYPHKTFDEGDVLKLSEQVVLHALNTPGHSPDSISILLKVEGRVIAIFSGDAVLIGGVGRPDLREYSGEHGTQREKLARQLFHTVQNKFVPLEDEVLLYPAHGAGSLCGNAIAGAKQSSIGAERKQNFAFEKQSEADFVRFLLADQPVIPVYFPYNVELNRQGAASFLPSITAVPAAAVDTLSDLSLVVLDARPSAQFRRSHLSGAINIPERLKSESWIGTLIAPNTDFYLVTENKEQADVQLAKLAKIGYEKFVKGFVLYGDHAGKESLAFDKVAFDNAPQDYYMLDVRTEKEAKENPVFTQAHNIPLAVLQQQVDKLPTDKPIVVYCASGYRSAIASSLIQQARPEALVSDIGDIIKYYNKSYK